MAIEPSDYYDPGGRDLFGSMSRTRIRCQELAREGLDADTIVDTLGPELGMEPDLIFLIAHAEVGRVTGFPLMALR